MRLDVQSPIGAMLDAARGTVRFHMPGHKGQLCAGDMTELARTDDLYAPAGAIAEAERLAALACGAAHTLLLTGGSTAGLMAMILSSIPPGGRLLAARDVHHAVLSACVWGGIDVIFVEDVAEAVAACPQADAVLVTRPDYHGRCLDLAPVAQAAHARSMPVLVDEAHGAHFPWWDVPAAQSAGRLGADAWVQSAHKTLPALGGAAWLHLAAHMDAARARRFLRMVQTSSPPFPILRSLDDCRAWMDLHGRPALAALCDKMEAVRARIDAMEGLHVPRADDPTRLLIDARGRGLTGMALDAALAARGVDVEMSDEAVAVCICTVADTDAMRDALLAALDALPVEGPLPPVDRAALPAPGARALSVRQAALGPQERVALALAAGKIAAVSAGMYPPGIPLVLPGEVVTQGVAACLMGLPPARRFGVEDGCIICAKQG